MFCQTHHYSGLANGITAFSVFMFNSYLLPLIFFFKKYELKSTLMKLLFFLEILKNYSFNHISILLICFQRAHAVQESIRITYAFLS